MSTKAHRRKHGNQTDSRRDLWGWGLILAFIVAVGLIVLGGVLSSGEEKEKPSKQSSGSSDQLASGVAPSFSVTDAVSGETVTKADYRGRNLLLFFSEGVSCQACMVQVTALERRHEWFKRNNLALVSVSVDSADQLRQVAEQIEIKTTPLLADEDSQMMTDYDMLGKGGMGHSDRGGHAFMLVSKKGKILWEKAYQEMYVEPSKLFKEMPKL